jgi:hypothetical protein
LWPREMGIEFWRAMRAVALNDSRAGRVRTTPERGVFLPKRPAHVFMATLHAPYGHLHEQTPQRIEAVWTAAEARHSGTHRVGHGRFLSFLT